MSEDLDQIKTDLTAANELVANVAADVQRLDDKITALGDGGADVAQIADIKNMSAQLRANLQAVADKTPEYPAPAEPAV